VTGSGEVETRLTAEAAPADEDDPTAQQPCDAWALHAVAELAAEGMAVLEGGSALDARISWCNSAFERIVGTGVIGRGLLELGTAGTSGDVLTALADAARWGDALVSDRDGAVTACRVRPAPPAHPSGAGPLRWVLMVSAATVATVIDEALRASEERFRALAAHAPIGVFFSEVGLRLGYVNERFCDLWGQPAAAALGMGWLSSVDPGDAANLVDGLSSVLAGDSLDVVVRVSRHRGTDTRWIRTRAAPVVLPGHGAGFVGSLEDITDTRRHEEALAWQATHDPLTGLPNRTLLWQRLEHMLPASGTVGPAARILCAPPSTHRPAAAAEAGADATALLFFDLDDFKLVNDTLGHQAGDELLTAVALRLADGVRPEDMVVRLGGDEFVVLCQVVSDTEATAIAERLQAALARPLALGATEVSVSASVGIVVADGHDAEGLLRDADVAMYQAKQAGKACFAVFDQRVRAGLQERMSLTGDLRRAIAGDELHVVYQPIWDVAGSVPRPVGVEALVRWDHPERGPIPPTQIVGLAEDHGLIDDLGGFVLRRACRDLARWRHQLGAGAPGYVAVNLCPAQLRQSGLVGQVADALAGEGLQGTDLYLELTETVVMDDTDAALEALYALRALDVRLAIDDFGTGYSSLAYLQRLPVQVVKIDRSFVGRIEDSPGDAAIVAAIVAMAEALGLTAIAEGVETVDHLAELRRLRCSLAQGYLFSRPVPADQIPTALGLFLPASETGARGTEPGGAGTHAGPLTGAPAGQRPVTVPAGGHR